MYYLKLTNWQQTKVKIYLRQNILKIKVKTCIKRKRNREIDLSRAFLFFVREFVFMSGGVLPCFYMWSFGLQEIIFTVVNLYFYCVLNMD